MSNINRKIWKYFIDVVNQFQKVKNSIFHQEYVLKDRFGNIRYTALVFLKARHCCIYGPKDSIVIKYDKKFTPKFIEKILENK